MVTTTQEKRGRPGPESGSAPDGTAAGRREWRRQAWEWACSGRWDEALNMQRALVTISSESGGIEALRDRFRLLRWELATGDWRGARDSMEAVIASLAARGKYSSVAIGWVFLARSILFLQLGAGGRYRQGLGRVIRAARRGKSKSLLRTAMHVGAAVSRISSEPHAPPGPLERGLQRINALSPARCRVPAGNDGIPEPEQWARLLEAQPSAAPGTGPAGLTWERILSGIIQGPQEIVALRTSLVSEMAKPGRLQPKSQKPQLQLVESWLEQEERSPAGATPPWAAPVLSLILEEKIPEMCPALRRRVHSALNRIAANMAEPWARAILLETLSEAALWTAGPDARDSAPQDTERLLSQARADLGLAAGLFRRLGWEPRAHRCEERWLRLTWPGFRAGVSERQYRPRNPGIQPGTILWAKQRLSDAGFQTTDRHTLQDLLPLLLLAPSPLPVLILGESGTGKEILTRALHDWSGLRGEFVPIHCGAIPRDLLESELFGHTRGAFTGASSDKPGLVEAADGGTLFLDEIGEMSMEAQMKMLRVLENGEVRRLGDLKARRARIRLVAATHRNLEESVADGRFRLDLYHRIRGVVVRLRPLRERPLDIPVLASRFVRESHPNSNPLRLPEAALALLLSQTWPGNVRELKGTLLRACHLARALGADTLKPEYLGLDASADRYQGAASALASLRDLLGAHEQAGGWPRTPDRELVEREGLDGILEDLERRLILQALEKSRWNRTHAARSLGGLSRTTLLSKMKRLGITDPTPGAMVHTEED